MKIKKIKFFILFFLATLLFFSNVYAASSIRLEIVQEASDTVYLEDNSGYVSKKIVASDPENGEVTIELKVNNSANEDENYGANEIVFVIDNSLSMGFTSKDGKVRKETIINSAIKLSDEIFNATDSVKVGLVDFHGSDSSIYAASIRQNLTSNKDTIKSALQNELSKDTESGTNIEAGVAMGEYLFSDMNNNKVMILLTDGIPTDDVHGNFAGDIDENGITEEHRIICENTKKTIESIKNEGIYTIALMTGMNMEDLNEEGEPAFASQDIFDASIEASELVFGTSDNPTTDKYYLTDSADVEKVITDDILKDVSEQMRKPLNNIKVVDYFPDDVISDFELTIDGNPSKGQYSNNQNSNIEWTIDELQPGESATLRYKLKVKNINDENLLNKVFSTNKNVMITYEDDENNSKSAVVTTSPRVRFAVVQSGSPSQSPSSSQNPSSTTTKPVDDTTSKEMLPKTGITKIVSAFVVSFAVVSLGIYLWTKKFKDVK